MAQRRRLDAIGLTLAGSKQFVFDVAIEEDELKVRWALK